MFFSVLLNVPVHVHHLVCVHVCVLVHVPFCENSKF
jgi:hypothetical protein